MLLYPKAMKLCVLIAALNFYCCSAQQTYERKGSNFDARVMIHRQTFDNNPQRPNPGQWRQGDRVTKQEVIQNLARALLSRKQTPDEREDEQRKNNALKLQQYALSEAKNNILMKKSKAGKGHVRVQRRRSVLH